MPQNEQITKKEHYVPQVYLRGFSPDGKNIFEYRMKDGHQPLDSIPIDSICRVKNLYEVQNEKDEIVATNFLENCLRELEKEFAENKRKIKKLASIESNYNSLYFLHTKEKVFWKLYILFQMLRSPKVIEQIQMYAENEFDDQLKRNEARQFALNVCLPFFEPLQKEEHYLILDLYSVLQNMFIAVGVDETDSLFTSDLPVFCFAPEHKMEYIEEVRFPLTSNLMIFLFRDKTNIGYRKNCLFHIQEKELPVIKKSIAYSATEWIYSKRPLSDEEKKLISEAYSEKIADMSK